MVSNGWHDGRETNTVLFDPARIAPDDMIAALRKAGTFAGVARDSMTVPAWHH